MTEKRKRSSDRLAHDSQAVFTRRTALVSAGAFVAAAPLGALSAARAFTGPGEGSFRNVIGQFPLCHTTATSVVLPGEARPLKLAWNATAICTSAAPVAKERGVFARHNLDVDFINFGGSTEQLLEAIATGKADAGIGMALRWLKPLEQGFDVRITTGVHGGCMRLLGSKSGGIDNLASLRGKSIAISDEASPAKNFFSIVFTKHGIDPEKDIEWRPYPGDLLALAVQKGEVRALADNDPRTYLWLKEGTLNEVATNLSGEYADRVCCVLAIRGSLVRDERPVATALTQAVLEAGELVASNPSDAAAMFSGYGGKGSIEDLTAMLQSHTHHNHPIGDTLKNQIALYTDELKLVNVIKPSTDSAKFANRVYADVLS
jgi:NitT/TauT family transport system substrate-binding protein